MENEESGDPNMTFNKNETPGTPQAVLHMPKTISSESGVKHQK